jgi:hypothetical protein
VPDTRASPNAGAGPVVISDLLIANLETRRFASLRPSLPIGRKFRFDMNSGAASTPMVAPEGACRSRDGCRSSKRRGAVALVREQPPHRSSSDCWKRTDAAALSHRSGMAALSSKESRGAHVSAAAAAAGVPQPGRVLFTWPAGYSAPSHWRRPARAPAAATAIGSPGTRSSGLGPSRQSRCAKGSGQFPVRRYSREAPGGRRGTLRARGRSSPNPAATCGLTGGLPH